MVTDGFSQATTPPSAWMATSPGIGLPLCSSEKQFADALKELPENAFSPFTKAAAAA